MKFLKDKWLVILPIVLALIIVAWSGHLYVAASRSDASQTIQTTQQAPYSGPTNALTASQSADQQQPQEVQPSMPGCTCHSKKPSMVRMHDALRGENCGDCHKPGENLMDPNRPPTPKAEMDKRIKTEAACRKCHLDNSTILSKTPPKAQGAAKIKGALFCPKCKKQVTIRDATCSTCGGTITKTKSGWQCSVCGPLVDVDKIAAMSEKKPSNDICKICHFDKRKLTQDHDRIEAFNKRLADVPGGLNNCLGCHKSHNQCGGCHF